MGMDRNRQGELFFWGGTGGGEDMIGVTSTERESIGWLICIVSRGGSGLQVQSQPEREVVTGDPRVESWAGGAGGAGGSHDLLVFSSLNFYS